MRKVTLIDSTAGLYLRRVGGSYKDFYGITVFKLEVDKIMRTGDVALCYSPDHLVGQREWVQIELGGRFYFCAAWHLKFVEETLPPLPSPDGNKGGPYILKPVWDGPERNPYSYVWEKGVRVMSITIDTTNPQPGLDMIYHALTFNPTLNVVVNIFPYMVDIGQVKISDDVGAAAAIWLGLVFEYAETIERWKFPGRRVFWRPINEPNGDYCLSWSIAAHQHLIETAPHWMRFVGFSFSNGHPTDLSIFKRPDMLDLARKFIARGDAFAINEYWENPDPTANPYLVGRYKKINQELAAGGLEGKLNWFITESGPTPEYNQLLTDNQYLEQTRAALAFYADDPTVLGVVQFLEAGGDPGWKHQQVPAGYKELFE